MTASDYITISFAQDEKIKIDIDDSDLINFPWRLHKGNGGNLYAASSMIGELLMHRAIIARIIGRPLVKGEVVDHIDGNGLNNRRENLRVATPTQNQQNRKLNKNNKTGFKGVEKRNLKYRAVIRVNKKRILLGTFVTAEVAAIAYNEAALKYFGSFARLNKVSNE